jgi:copper chaperone CopZ
MVKLDLRVEDLDCEHDAARLRRAASLPGVEIIQILAQAGRLQLQLDDEQTSEATLKQHLEVNGFPVRPGVIPK